VKNIFFIIYFVLGSISVCAQTEINFDVSRGFRFLEYDQAKVLNIIKSEGYNYKNISSNFITYNKSSRISSYDFSIAFKNNKITAISWDEFIGNLQFASNQLEFLKFKQLNHTNTYNGDFFSFENVSRNLIASIITKGNYFTITIGQKYPDKPFIKQSFFDNIDLKKNKEIDEVNKAENLKNEKIYKERYEIQQKYSNIVFNIDTNSYPIQLKEFTGEIKKNVNIFIEKTIPSYENILRHIKDSRPKYNYIFYNNYKLSWNSNLEDGVENTTRKYEIKIGKDSAFLLFQNFDKILIPKIILENDISVPNRAISLDINVHFVRGVAILGIGKKINFFGNNVPYLDSQDIIKSKSANLTKGTYIVKYEHGNVMGEKIEKIEFIPYVYNSSNPFY